MAPYKEAAQVAKELGVSRRTLGTFISQGRIKPGYIGRRPVFFDDQIEAAVRMGKLKP